MKAKYILLFSFFFLFITCCKHDHTYSNLNLSFEIVENGMPKGWSISYHKQSNYSVSLDSINVKSGKYAIIIEFTGDSVGIQSISLVLPNNYEGKKITLSGYIKTDNVTDGYAELGMYIYPIRAVNMLHNGVTGTTDWKKYEITLDSISEQIQQIIIGGILRGKGKMWIDGLEITIDGKNVEKIQPYIPEPFSEKAKNDKEFDKGSHIVFPELTEQKIEDLELLGRIWGFLKYHHPAIVKGNYNWDYELFRILPGYLKATNNQQRDKILIKWINKYGRIPKCKTCQPTSESAFLEPDLSWIEKSNSNLKLKDLLNKIYLNRNQGSHYYIAMNDGNPEFTNEKAYGTEKLPDDGFRLLALYRFWNTIHYFFPYKHLTDKDWNIVLNEYIPYFINVKNRMEYENTVTFLIGEVCDSHAYLQKEEGIDAIGQVPALVGFVENKLVVLEYYAEKNEYAELKKGDVITHIEGKSVEAIIDSLKRYFPASNEAARLRDISREILRTKKNYIFVDYISSRTVEQKKLYVGSRDMYMYYRYRKEREDTAKCYKFLNKDIGYITLKRIKNTDVGIIKEKFMNTKGIIIDIRNYPSARVDFSLGSYFVSNPTLFVKFTKGNSDNPGEFTYKDETVIPKLANEETYQGKLVVIVNEETQSSAEFHAMAFRAGDNTTIIGSQTAGANGNVSTVVLPGGLETRISGIGVYYPDGRETQRVGIVPDIEVKPTINGIREGRDELLEKAIEIIKQGSK